MLLIRRLAPPFEGRYALLGGFIHPDESIHAAAARELLEETGVARVYLEQLYTFGDPKRDPRGRVLTVAYYALVANTHVLRAGTDAADAAWFPAAALPSLAFDHRRIVEYARQRIRNKLAGKSLRRYFRVGSDQNIGIENNPHLCQLRRGRTSASASSSADSISWLVVSGEICEAISSRCFPRFSASSRC